MSLATDMQLSRISYEGYKTANPDIAHILSPEEIKHIHKVLSSDVCECRILSGIDKTGETAYKRRMRKRMQADNRIRKKLETLLGYKPEWQTRKTG